MKHSFVKFLGAVVLAALFSSCNNEAAKTETASFSLDSAKAAIAAGADGLFIETHPNPSKAKSDGANMLKLGLLEPLLEKLVKLRAAI